MRDFFDGCKLSDSLSENRVNKIKYSVLSRVEGDKPMKKRFNLKPLIIAAVVMATMALSVVTVNAATNGEFLSRIFKTHGSNAFTTKYGDIYIDVEAYESDGGSGYAIHREYSDGFSSFDVKSFSYDLEDKFGSDVPGRVDIWIMNDGGMLGFKYIFSTGEISLLNDTEIQNILDNYEPSSQRIMSDEEIQFILDNRKELGLTTL